MVEELRRRVREVWPYPTRRALIVELKSGKLFIELDIFARSYKLPSDYVLQDKLEEHNIELRYYRSRDECVREFIPCDELLWTEVVEHVGPGYRELIAYRILCRGFNHRAYADEELEHRFRRLLEYLEKKFDAPGMGRPLNPDNPQAQALSAKANSGSV